MLSEEDIKKINDFVDHLIGLPNIKNEPMLIAEGLILNFLVQNTNQLKATFKTPQFFPHLEWNEVIQVLISNLFDRVSNEIVPVFSSFIENTDFTFLNKIDGPGRNIPQEYHQEQLSNFFSIIFQNKDVRFQLNSAYNIFKYSIVEKYFTEIFKRRESLFNELVRVQKINIECDEYINLIKLVFIIKTAAYIKIPYSSSGVNSKVNIIDSMKMPGKPTKFLNAMSIHVKSLLPNIPERLLNIGLSSNLKESLTEMEFTAARFVFILHARFHNYKPVQRIDRGAESPDKSWFAIARKNADYHGFDKRLLDALYRLAGDNNW